MIKDNNLAIEKQESCPVNFAVIDEFGSNSRRLVELTLGDAENFMTTIKVSIEKVSCEELGLAAHSLKSIVAQVGANKLAEMARELELKCKEPGCECDSEFVKALFNNIQSEYLIFREALLNYLKDSS